MHARGSWWAPTGFGCPEAVLLEQDVGEDDELPHDGDQGDFVLLSSFAQSPVEGFQRWVEADRHHRGHVHRASRHGAAASHAATALVLAAVAGPRGCAEQSRGGASVEAPQFRHLGDQSGGRGCADAGNRSKDFGAAGKPFIGIDRGEDGRIECHDTGAQGSQLQRHLPQSGLRFELRGQLAQIGAFIDKAPPGQDEVLELAELLGRRRRDFQLLQAPETRQHRGIDAIRLGQLAEGLGETTGAGRLHQDGFTAVRGQTLVQTAVVATGRFEDHAANAFLA